MNIKINYRPDIDGLRAVAVLSVVFYHAGIKWFSGGYVGVDVFFVISGYLITTILVREIEANEFSILQFYERRIRRIYPALYTTLLFILIAAYFLYTPENFALTGKSSAATVGFISNILFWTESGYFDAPSTLKPLLHTWSLAVEEQFYIVFPLLIFLIMRFARRWLWSILAGIALISFLLSLYSLQLDAPAAFYLTHLRAWELLIGGLLAVNIFPIKKNGNTRHLLSFSGIILILGSMITYTETTSFPGMSAILPTVGSALIIFSGMEGESVVGKVLSWSPLVFIGKISYSLYLWHWPIIILGRYYLIESPSTAQMSLLVLISFVVSAFSWLVVEKPFRSRSFLPAPKIFAVAGSVMASVLAFSGLIYLKQGLPGRFDEKEVAAYSDISGLWGQQKKCNLADGKVFDGFNRCMLGDGSSDPTFVLWGDSHAQALAPAIDSAALRYGATGYLANQSACPPLLDIYREGDTTCIDFNNKILGYIEAHPEWETILLAGRWALSADGTRYKTEEGADVTLIDLHSPAVAGSNALLFETGLDRTIQKLLALDRRIIIISSVPEIGYDVPSAYFIALRTGRDVNQIIAPTFSEYRQRNAVVFVVLTRLEDHYPIQVIDPGLALCDETICNVVMNGNPLYQDAHHLSIFGSLSISSIFNSIFEN